MRSNVGSRVRHIPGIRLQLLILLGEKPITKVVDYGGKKAGKCIRDGVKNKQAKVSAVSFVNKRLDETLVEEEEKKGRIMEILSGRNT